MKPLTNSALSTFRSCPKRYEYRYVMGYTPVKKSDALYFGSEVHKGIEEYYKGKRTDMSVLGRAVIDGYERVYKNEPYKILGIEQKFEFPLIEPETGEESQDFYMSGVIDGIIQNEYGNEMIKEIKTASNPDDKYFEKLRLDPQISTYFIGAHILGHDIFSCLYDVIKKPGLRRKKDETEDQLECRKRDELLGNPEKHFIRRIITRSKQEIGNNLQDIWMIAKTIVRYRTEGFPRYTDKCFMYNSQCPYYQVCCGADSLDNKILYERLEDVNRELNNNNGGSDNGTEANSNEETAR